MPELDKSKLVDLVHAIGHDLKAPVRHIRDFFEFFTEENDAPLNDQQLIYKHHINTSTTDLNLQIERLLIYVKLYTRPDSHDDINIGDLVDSAIMSDPLYASANINWVKPLNPSILNIHSNSYNLQLAIEELLSNAVKFKKDDSPNEINITASLKKNHIELIFSDSGVGISSSLINQAFKPYRRLNLKEKHSGSGMGLPIALSAIEQVGGTLELRNNERGGMDACLTIPKEAPETTDAMSA